MSKIFERTPETIELNSKLEIVKIDHDYKFLKSDFEGMSTSGYCFYIEGKGYLAFKGNAIPYNPIGRINALQSILDAGGFLNYEDIKFINPINEIGIQKIKKNQ